MHIRYMQAFVFNEQACPCSTCTRSVRLAQKRPKRTSFARSCLFLVGVYVLLFLLLWLSTFRRCQHGALWRFAGTAPTLLYSATI